MSRITGVMVALATTAAVLGGSTAEAATGTGAPPAAELPREITRGVEVTLVDGDLFRVWTSRSHRTVWGTRRDAATGTWSEPAVVLRRKHLFCGDVDARTGGGAVAVTAECDRHGWSDN